MLPRRGPSFFFMALHAATPETCSTVHGQQEKRGGSLLGPGLSECKQGNTHLAACLMASRGPSGIEAHHLLIQLQLQAETGSLILNGPV